MTGLEYFTKALNQYTDIKGRARRSEYWYFRLFTLLFVYPLLIVGLATSSPFMISMGCIASLGFVVPGFCVAVRRLHDTGKSGTHLLISLVPLVGPIIMLVWFCTEGEIEDNQWGPNPKEFEAAFHDISKELV